MTITEALRIIQRAPRDGRNFLVLLACGFTPLHLQTFLAAHLQLALPDRKVTVATGLYGDLAGTLESLSQRPTDGVVIALEWADLDSRLDFRNAGGWGVSAATDIVASAQLTLDRIASVLLGITRGVRIALSLPTLPLPPLFHTPGWQASEEELLLRGELFRFAAELARGGRVTIVSPARVDEQSSPSTSFDFKGHLNTGLPYTIAHADVVASHLALALVPPAPKKGIISDLDDTLWRGIVGEVGSEGVSWDLASHTHLHGLYQKLLAALSEQGTLVAVASKNDPAVVAKAFERRDLLLRPEQVFPIEVHWNAKSGSVSRILETWNIAADSVIFVDDSPMELAEVAAAHPGIECVLFAKDDHAAGLAMLRRLRDLCGKERVTKDDTLRLDSIRQGAAFREQTAGGSVPDAFLRQVEAVVTFDFDAAAEPRTLELVNKTNQFNLNGARFTESEWRTATAQRGALAIGVSYEDKFGPLGTIAVVAGVAKGERFSVDVWVMSCRAFARRIEHRTLKLLFDTTGASEIDFAFSPTAKNGPTQQFFAGVLGEKPAAAFRLTRSQFEEKCPALYHEVRELRRAEAHG